jgi:hypothetical protein
MATTFDFDSDSAWDASRTEAFFASLQAPGVAETIEFASPHHAAAAVLAAFDPAVLRGMNGEPPAAGDALVRLMADSTVVANPSGSSRWCLSVEPRQQNLHAFTTIEQLRKASKANSRDQAEPLQRILDICIFSTLPPVEQIDEKEIVLATEVVGWMTGVPTAEPLSLPSIDDLRRRADYIRLIKPLKQIVGTHFRGRAAELSEIRRHLESPNRPLMVSGVGGMGKSTLLAHAALDCLEGRGPTGAPSPVVFLDFDLRTLIAEEPATLLLEAVRQIRAQSPVPENHSEALIRLLEDDLAHRLPSIEPEAMSSALRSDSTRADRLQRFQELLLSVPAWRSAPVLVAIDTFERVQYRSRQTVELIWQFLGQIRDKIFQSRVIVGGRVEVDQPHIPLRLLGLDAEAAVACLVNLNVPANIASRIYKRVGGNPLMLRLAAELVAREKSDDLLDYLDGQEFRLKLQQELAQGFLFRRIVGHIHDPDVRKLVEASLVLRRITVELIAEVLAPVCKIQISGKKPVQTLWDELAKETALVIQVSGNELRHRPELRRELIGLMQLLEEEQRRAQVIHEAAIKYYMRFENDTAARAEELYHRLALSQPPTELDARWDDQAEASLRESVDELPAEAMAYLSGKSRAPGLEAVALDDAFWATANLQLWERKTEAWVHDLLRQDRFSEALTALMQRADRSPTSPLFLLEARVLKSMGNWAAARTVLESALSGWPSADPGGRLDLLLLLFRVCEHSGDRLTSQRVAQETRAMVDQARGIDPHLQPSPFTPGQILEACWADTRAAAEGSTQRHNERHRLSEEIARFSDRELLTVPAVARRIAGELLPTDPQVAQRVLNLMGLGAVGPERLKLLIDALPMGLQAVNLGMEEFAKQIVGFIGKLPLSGGVLNALQEVLAGDAAVSDRVATASIASQLRALKKDQFKEVCDAILEAFNRNELALMVNSRLNVRLDSVVRTDAPMSILIYDLLTWCEQTDRLGEFIEAVISERQNNWRIQQLPEFLGLKGTLPPTFEPDGIRLRDSQRIECSSILTKAFGDSASMPSLIDKLAQMGLPSAPLGALAERANKEGWMGRLLAAARDVKPNDPGLYYFTEDFSLTAVRPQDDRLIRDVLHPADIDQVRSQLGELEQRVCRIVAGPGGAGTGFLVGPDLVLTAYHVVQSMVADGPKDAFVEFDFRRLENGTVVNPGKKCRLADQWLVAKREYLAEWIGDPSRDNLNYALIRVRSNPGASRGWINLAEAPVTVTAGAPLCMMYFGGDSILRFSLDQSSILGLTGNGNRLMYRLTAEPGASGAPVLNENFLAVAMHHARLTNYSNRDSEREGILLAKIAEDLDKQGVTEAFAARPDRAV